MQGCILFLTIAHLVGEAAAHDEARVACGTSQVEQAALSQHNHAMAIREDEAVHLGLDVLALDSCNMVHVTTVATRAYSQQQCNTEHRWCVVVPAASY